MEGAPLSNKETWHALQACGGRQTVFSLLSASKATQSGKWPFERGVGRMTDDLCLGVFWEDTAFLPWEQGGQGRQRPDVKSDKASQPRTARGRSEEMHH